jgi:hypothetical protein
MSKTGTFATSMPKHNGKLSNDGEDIPYFQPILAHQSQLEVRSWSNWLIRVSQDAFLIFGLD